MRKRMYFKFFILGIVTLGMMMVSTDMMSQGRGHFKFEGEPIDGPALEYARGLRGYERVHVNKDSSAVVVKGKYRGIRDCEVFVLGDELTKATYAVSVNCPWHDDWASVEEDYTRLFNSLVEEYGTPAKDVRTKVDYGGNRQTMIMLNMGLCSFKAVWEFENGEIRLGMDGKSSKKLQRDYHFRKAKPFDLDNYDVRGRVVVYFLDKANHAERQTVMDKLQGLFK